MTGHEGCDTAARAYTEVTCDRCGTTYVCTPERDHYCAADGDHCCEPCLLGGMGVSEVVVMPEVPF